MSDRWMRCVGGQGDGDVRQVDREMVMSDRWTGRWLCKTGGQGDGDVRQRWTGRW